MMRSVLQLTPTSNFTVGSDGDREDAVTGLAKALMGLSHSVQLIGQCRETPDQYDWPTPPKLTRRWLAVVTADNAATLEWRTRTLAKTLDGIGLRCSETLPSEPVRLTQDDIESDSVYDGNDWCATLVLREWPREVAPGWLGQALAGDLPVDVAIHVEPQDAQKVARFLKRQQSWQGEGKDAADELGRDDAERVRRNLIARVDKPCKVAIVLTVRAPDRATLRTRVETLRHEVGLTLAEFRPAFWEHDRGLEATEPNGVCNILGAYTTLDCTSVASTWIMQPATVLHQNGAAIGTTHDGGMLVKIDPFDPSLESFGGIVIAKVGAGKALALDTPVPTPTGWTTMGELQQGDLVFDESGKPTRVAEAWPVLYDRPCYEVEFSDGTTVVADADHQWLTHSLPARRSQSQAKRWDVSRIAEDWRDQRHKRIQPSVVTTAQIAASVKWNRGREFNHAIPVAGPLELPEAILPVDPYVLGVWLGDGTSSNGNITTADVEVVDQVQQAGWAVTPIRTSAYGYVVRGLGRPLTALGVRGRPGEVNAARHKHIPAAYLRASIAQRLAMLQGLMDTDGTCGKNGACEFTSTRERLARDAYELVCSLGIKASIRMKPCKGKSEQTSIAYTVAFSTLLPVFRLPRKLARQRSVVRGTQARRYVVAVRPVPSVPVRCIAVESENHLFLVTRSCVPTHNSYLMKLIARRLQGVEVLIVEQRNPPEYTGVSGATTLSLADVPLAERTDRLRVFVSDLWETAKSDPRPRLLILDELWSLIRDPNLAALVEEIARIGRHHYLALWICTQQCRELIDTGKAVIDNAAVRIYLRQHDRDLDALCEAVGLTAPGRRFLRGAGRGQALIDVGGLIIPVDIQASPAEHALITTDPREKYAQQLVVA